MVVKSPADVQDETFADLHARLGFVPLSRIRMKPTPGTATEADVIRFAHAADKRLYELVDGTLVEKSKGTLSAILAPIISHRILTFLEKNDLGLVTGAAGPFRMLFGNIRYPDVSFIPWSELPDDDLPEDAIWSVVPHLAIEVLSESNTEAEITRKIGELFARGCKLFWVIDLPTRSARIYTSPRRSKAVEPTGVIDGGKVLPGFKLPMSELFAVTRRREKKG